MRIAVVAIIVVAIIVIGAAAYVLTRPAPKYQIELWYNNSGHYGDTEDELATVLKNSIETCGKVQVTLKSEIWADYRQSRNQGKLPFFLLGWYPDYSDTDDYLAPFLQSSGSPSFGSFYSNSTVDQWVLQEQTSTSAAVRTDAFNKLQDKLATDVPYIPLFSGYSEAAYVSGMTGVVLHPIMFKWFIVDKPNSREFNASTTDDITSLDPALAYDYFSIELVNQIFDTLITYEPVTSNLMPSLATQVPTIANGGVSADGKNYTYVLRPGLVFSDGTALNATVVKRSLDRTIRLNDPGGAAFLLWDSGKLGRDATNGNNTPVGAIEVHPDLPPVGPGRVLQRPDRVLRVLGRPVELRPDQGADGCGRQRDRIGPVQVDRIHAGAAVRAPAKRAVQHADLVPVVRIPGDPRRG